jgi:acyl-CoA thioester hydrolase
MNRHALSKTTSFEVPFHHCDPLDVVWHGRYLEYFEVARQALFRELALDVPKIRELGFRMYVTDARCRYMFPLHYADAFEVTARVTETRPFIRIAYEVQNLTCGRKSARATTTLATTDALGKLIPETPDAILARLSG